MHPHVELEFVFVLFHMKRFHENNKIQVANKLCHVKNTAQVEQFFFV